MTKARENPFAIDRIEREIEFDPKWCGTSWPEIFERWQKLDHRAAIVGAHGSGKTFFLRAFQQRLNQPVAAFFLNDENPSLSDADWQRLQSATDADSVIFLDGAEQLDWTTWRKFQRKVSRRKVLVTRHRKARWPTLLNTSASPKLLAHLIKKLSSETRSATETATLLSRHKGNLREALWECYDHAANRRDGGRTPARV